MCSMISEAARSPQSPQPHTTDCCVLYRSFAYCFHKGSKTLQTCIQDRSWQGLVGTVYREVERVECSSFTVQQIESLCQALY